MKEKPEEPEPFGAAINGSPIVESHLVFRKSERNSRTSRAILPITPAVLEGLSRGSDLIQGSVFCCPQVVGMQKGTGDRAQFTTR